MANENLSDCKHKPVKSIKYCKTSDSKMADTVSRYLPVEQEQYSYIINEVQILYLH